MEITAFDFLKEQNEKIVAALKGIGFPEDEAKKQLSDLGQVIILAVIDRMQKEHPGNPDLNENNLEAFIATHYPLESFDKIFAEVGNGILAEYFGAILKGRSEEETKNFMTAVSQLDDYFMIEYFQILDKNELALLRGRSAGFENLKFSFSDSYIEKLAALFDLNNYIQLFAKDSETGEIVGYIAAAEILEKNYITIAELFVEPTYQTKGIGVELVSRIIKFGKKKNLNGAMTQTEFENIPAQKLYEKIGFVKINNPAWKEGITYKLNFMSYKHTQIGYLMLVVTLAVLVLFAWVYIMASAEPPSADSGPNFAVTAIMALILFILASFGSLQVIIDGKYLRIKFGYGIYQKKLSLNDIMSAKTVKNHWYYGWGIRGWFWPKMWIYNVSGFDAVEIKLKNGKTYRIGTDESKKLKQAILHSIK